MAPGLRWRPMLPRDLAGVTAIADQVHRAYPEDVAVFRAARRLYPSGCKVAERGDGTVLGYLVSHPGRLDRAPVIDQPMTRLAEPFDCYFLHDLALLPEARGQGLAAQAVDLVIAEAQHCGIATIALVAVGDAHGFWERQGFRCVGDGLLPPDKNYGPEARLMVRGSTVPDHT